MMDDGPESDSEVSQNTVEIPSDSAPNAKEGDVVSFKVVSIDSDNGVLNCVPMSNDEEESGESATDHASKKFDNLDTN